MKLFPLICSDLVADTLALALEARSVDVAASPYDASEYVPEPIRIETEEGRLVYRAKQREIMKRSVALRMRVTESYEEVINDVERRENI